MMSRRVLSHQIRGMHGLGRYSLSKLRGAHTVNVRSERQFMGLVGAVARHVLKLRYFVATGVIGGSVAAKNWYEEWKSNLPDLNLPDWAKFEDNEALRGLADRLTALRDGFGNTDGAEGKMAKWLQRLEEFRRDRQGTVTHFVPLVASASMAERSESTGTARGIFSSIFTEKKTEEEPKAETLEERLRSLQDELLKTQSQYQRELERLEKENKTLRQRIILSDAGEVKRLKRLKRSLIDMYSEVLDLLNEYDSSYNTADNLPRVVVVGDQSAGKTSVLEMVAQARMFPRGSGEMMTRAPVKVTLSGGPYRVAQFKDSTREFDLNKESELEQLRQEIEVRMRNSVREGRTVSNEVIALTVKGPDLPRMVLVDLPGVISTVTADMAKETKDDIIRMSRQYMENPNAIILCIQDGSVDAERSNVTDLVSSIDPSGQRTILVLTKVDVAEANSTNPDRIKKILEGKLFPMKALGYYGVVTGRGNSRDSIEDIRKYEQEFFQKSQLLRDGVLKPTQLTTRNMSFAVSECFWRMVRDSIESQTDAFRATRFNLETEWRNTFPRHRQLDRDELFEKARGEVLDELVNLSLLSPDQWEHTLETRLWDAISPHIFDQILLPASVETNPGSFNTFVDIRLKRWVDKELAEQSIHAGCETQRELFSRQMGDRRKEDELFDPLKEAIVDEAMKGHKWDEKAGEYLKTIQLNAIEDRNISDRRAWDTACSFMYTSACTRLEAVKEQLRTARGPSVWRKWVYWQTPTVDEHFAAAVQDEAFALLNDDPNHTLNLSPDDLTVIKRNLELKGIGDVPSEVVRQQWRMVYKKHFLEGVLQSASDSKSLYQHYRQGEIDVDCQNVLLFHRLHNMLKLTCSTLRQQITNTEQRRLEREIKELLDDWSQETEIKKKLLTGRRVELAEELKQVRRIQEKLEQFMLAMQRENH